MFGHPSIFEKSVIQSKTTMQCKSFEVSRPGQFLEVILFGTIQFYKVSWPEQNIFYEVTWPEWNSAKLFRKLHDLLSQLSHLTETGPSLSKHLRIYFLRNILLINYGRGYWYTQCVYQLGTMGTHIQEKEIPTS